MSSLDVVWTGAFRKEENWYWTNDEKVIEEVAFIIEEKKDSRNCAVIAKSMFRARPCKHPEQIPVLCFKPEKTIH